MKANVYGNVVSRSIPLKICLSILLIETVLLTILGIYYTTSFNKEVDISVHQKLLLPSVLMSDRALNYEAVRELGVMSELLQERVVKACIINTRGLVFYGSDAFDEGSDFNSSLSESEQDFFARDVTKARMMDFVSGSDTVISILAPIHHQDKLLGALYLQIDGNGISEKKRTVAFTFFMGALVAIGLTTIFEAFLVYRLIVPRVERTSEVLSQVESSQFSSRVEKYGSPDQLGTLMAQVDQMIDELERSFNKIRDAEKKYRDLFMSAREGIFRVSSDGKLLDGNPALADLLGFTSYDEMNECRNDSLLKYLESNDDLGVVRSHLVNGGSVQNQELHIKRKDGKSLTVSLSTHMILDKDGKLKAYEGRVIDISDQKKKERADAARQAAEAVANAQLEMVSSLEEKNRQLQYAYEELKTTQQQLLKSERMAILGMTASGVAHDLNNILMGLIGYPEFLLTEIPDDSPLRRPLEAILISGKRAAAVVSDMLTLSRDVASKKENLSLNQLVREYLSSLEFKSAVNERPEIDVITDLDDSALYVSVSPIHIQKVIMNLVTNALEAIGGTGQLTISTSMQRRLTEDEANNRREHDYCVLAVTDNGCGIPEEHIEHIFDPFYTSKVMGKSGSGLGLTIVQNVIKQHDGSIELHSSDSGTTFTVYLPAGGDPIKKLSVAEGMEDYSGTEKILLVDDEPLLRDLGTRYLTTLGYSVDAVASGEEAIEYLKKFSVDLLILDMIMAPGIDGLQTYKGALRIVPDQKAIIVSGYAPDEAVREAQNLGVYGFVPKPYSINKLAQNVRNALDS